MKTYICNVCGWTYVEPSENEFSGLPEDFQCSVCGVDRNHFVEE